MKIEVAIAKEKSKLEKFAKVHGVWQDFGQKEINKITDKFINSSDYSPTMNASRKQIEVFSDWCENYCG